MQVTSIQTEPDPTQHPRVIGERVRFRPLLAWVAIVLLSLISSARAEQVIQVRLLEGMLIARCRVQTPTAEIPAHLLLELGSQHALVMQPEVGDLLKLDQHKKIDIYFDGGAHLADVPGQKRSVQAAETLSSTHAAELSEIPIVGMIGLGALQGQVVQIDLPGGVVRFANSGTDADSLTHGADAALLPLINAGRGPAVRVPDDSAPGQTVVVQFSTQSPHTLVDPEPFDAWKLGRPDAHPPKVAWIEPATLSAFRPQDLKKLGEQSPAMVLGTRVLRHARITIDRSNQKVWIERMTSAASADEPIADEQALFLGLHASDPVAVQAFLEKRPDSSLAAEAGSALLTLRLSAEKFDVAATRTALKLFANTVPALRRSRQMVMVADQLMESDDADRRSIAADALDIAAKDQTSDLDAAAVHQINARRGVLALRNKDYVQARRLLLAAAFGLPQDPQIAMWLGDLYRETGQVERAWSRYVRAALVKKPPQRAFEALDRLNRMPEFRKVFDAGEAQLSLEGVAPEYAPSIVRDKAEPRPKLVELFINLDDAAGNTGPQFAFAALRHYYEGAPVSFIRYDFEPTFTNAATRARAAALGMKTGPALVIDGCVVSQEKGSPEKAAALFDAYRTAGIAPSTQPATQPTPAVAIDTRLKRSDRTLDVQINVTGAASGTYAVRAYLVENVVFAATKPEAPMFHDAIVRQELLTGAGNDLSSGHFSVSRTIEMDAVDKAADAAWSAARMKSEEEGWRVRPTSVDPRQCVVVTFVEDAATHQVLAANTTPLEASEGP
ncbi:MAG: hypothetical protein QM770_23225 [Tepidisphaeraceae bacterium]